MLIGRYRSPSLILPFSAEAEEMAAHVLIELKETIQLVSPFPEGHWQRTCT